MTAKTAVDISIDKINRRFECKFDLSPNVSLEIAAFCLGMSNVLREVALDLNKTGSIAIAIDRLEEIHNLLLERIRAI